MMTKLDTSISGRVSLGFLAATLCVCNAFAAPADYTYTVTNVTQHLVDLTDPENPVKLPLDAPVYTGDITITGTFSYDASITGSTGAPIGYAPSAAEVVFPDVITNFSAVVNDENYHRDRTFAVLIDESTEGAGQIYGGDTLRTVSPSIFITQTFEIVHDGDTYTASVPGFQFSEGVEDGYNFFPDAALADTACDSCPSTAALPASLPPPGATVTRFYLLFRRADDARQYELRGDLEVAPVVPPEPVPTAENYTIRIEVTGHQFFDNDGNEIDLPNSPISAGDVIPGGFAYDPSVPPGGITGFLCGTTNCIANIAPAMPTDLYLQIAGQTYDNQSGILVKMADETTYPDLRYPPGPPWGSQFLAEPQDFISFEKPPFNPPTPNIAIPHDGVWYQLSGFNLNYFEGDTGHDFFPDSDPNPMFPAKLPPDGADFGTAIIWLRGEVEPGVSRRLSIFGDLTIKKEAIPVTIEIDPWSANNQVYPNSDNPIPVGIIASSTANGEAVDLDTTKIDPSSLRLGEGTASNTLWPLYEDFNGDRNVDVGYAFGTQDAGIACNDTEVTLTGETYDGTTFEGTGAIDASDCESGSCHPL